MAIQHVAVVFGCPSITLLNENIPTTVVSRLAESDIQYDPLKKKRGDRTLPLCRCAELMKHKVRRNDIGVIQND